MFETVSVDDALKRGKRNINIPVTIIILSGVLIPIGLSGMWQFPVWIVAVGFIAGFIMAWLYWSIAIVAWRIWAFDNVRNVHELKKRAVKEKLIWPDSSFLNKTEIWSADQRRQWNSLQYKFEREDVFNDDLSIPAETRIGFSKPTAMFLMLIGLGIIAIAKFYLLNDEKVRFLGFVLIAFGVFFAIKAIISYFDRRPRIILSNEGVESKKSKFYSWAEIYGEDTKIEQSGKSSVTYFIYYCPDGQKKIGIGDLDISKSKLEKLLLIYRGRYEHNRSKNINRRSTVI